MDRKGMPEHMRRHVQIVAQAATPGARLRKNRFPGVRSHGCALLSQPEAHGSLESPIGTTEEGGTAHLWRESGEGYRSQHISYLHRPGPTRRFDNTQGMGPTLIDTSLVTTDNGIRAFHLTIRYDLTHDARWNVDFAAFLSFRSRGRSRKGTLFGMGGTNPGNFWRMRLLGSVE